LAGIEGGISFRLLELKVNAPVIDEEESGGVGNKELVHHFQIFAISRQKSRLPIPFLA